MIKKSYSLGINFRLGFTPLLSLIRHRSLLKGFVSKEIRGRFAGSMAGMAWTLIHPLALIAVYTFVFSVVLRISVTQEETGTDNFIIFFLAGMLPWLIFSDSLIRATGSLTGNSQLITKVVFPVELLPGSSVVAATITHGIGLALFLGYLALTGHANTHWIFIFPLMLVHLVFTWGLALFLSALCVFIRDVQELVGIVIMVWFFTTPILYPVSFVPEWVREFILYNPMAILILSYRDIVLLHRFYPSDFLILSFIACACFLLGSWFFMRAKPAFGDVL